MNIQGKTALVTGANRGLGTAYAKALLAAGARKVYAGARDPATVTVPGVVPVKLNVTSLDDIAAAAAQCSDVDILVNKPRVCTGAACEWRRRHRQHVVGAELVEPGDVRHVFHIQGGCVGTDQRAAP